MAKLYKCANWSFTHYDDLEQTAKILESLCTEDGPIAYLSYQQETCHKTQKQHLQGFITLNWQVYKKGFYKTVLKLSDISPVGKDRIQEAIEYTQKEESRTADGISAVKGERPKTGNAKRAAETYSENRAKKIRKILDRLDEGQSKSSIYADLAVDNLELVTVVEEAAKVKDETLKAENAKLMMMKALEIKHNFYQWQRELWDHIQKPADDRTVIWVYDEIGNTGKSEFKNTLLTLKEGQVALLSNGKKADMLYLASRFKQRNYVIIDFPRTVMKVDDNGVDSCSVNFDAIEELKNGVFASTKYECEVVTGGKPHLLCFANFLPPDLSKLSLDRWLIGHINYHTKTANWYKVAPTYKRGCQFELNRIKVSLSEDS